MGGVEPGIPTGTADEGILAIVREVLPGRPVAADDELALHGATSLSIVRIIAVAARDLGLDIDPRDLTGPATARALAAVARPTGRVAP